MIIVHLICTISLFTIYFDTNQITHFGLAFCTSTLHILLTSNVSLFSTSNFYLTQSSHFTFCPTQTAELRHMTNRMNHINWICRTQFYLYRMEEYRFAKLNYCIILFYHIALSIRVHSNRPCLSAFMSILLASFLYLSVFSLPTCL